MSEVADITIVGLGPGDAGLLTVDARTVLADADEVWLRTARHPTVPLLPAGPRYESFDDVYEREPTFDAVYETIVVRLLDLGRRPAGVVYAVPGHPLFGEVTVRSLLLRAEGGGLTVRILPGVSFLDTISVALSVDPLDDGLLILDALSLDARGRRLAPERPTLIAQVYDRKAASQAKLALLGAYPPDHPVRVIGAAGDGNERVVETTVARLDHAEVFDHLVSLYLPPVDAFDAVRTFDGLRSVVAQLRAPDGGCPWDLEQTHASLKHFLDIEESYEALDVLETGDLGRLSEELGDLLMQVFLHAQIAEDNDEFTIEDVFEGIVTKLIRRHPHVFGDVEVDGASDVIRNWDELKRQERGDAPLLDAVPISLPALAQAQSALGRAAKAGLAPGAPPLAAVERLLADVASADTGDRSKLGQLLFGIVAIARSRDVDAEDALRSAVREFRDDVGARETAAREMAQKAEQKAGRGAS